LYQLAQKFAVINKLNEAKKEKVYELLKSMMDQYQKEEELK